MEDTGNLFLHIAQFFIFNQFQVSTQQKLDNTTPNNSFNSKQHVRTKAYNPHLQDARPLSPGLRP